jgi:hypothetical protein
MQKAQDVFRGNRIQRNGTENFRIEKNLPAEAGNFLNHSFFSK